MNQQIAEIQKAALWNIYERIKQIVKSMNGAYKEMALPSALSDQMSDGPSDSSVTNLYVELPSGLIVHFKPQNPLGIGNALSVNARRILPGSGTLDDRGFLFANDEWQSGGKALSDEVIRECLRSKGPVPIY